MQLHGLVWYGITMIQNVIVIATKWIIELQINFKLTYASITIKDNSIIINPSFTILTRKSLILINASYQLKKIILRPLQKPTPTHWIQNWTMGSVIWIHLIACGVITESHKHRRHNQISTESTVWGRLCNLGSSISRNMSHPPFSNTLSQQRGLCSNRFGCRCVRLKNEKLMFCSVLFISGF